LEALVLRRRELYDEQLRMRCGRYGARVRVSQRLYRCRPAPVLAPVPAPVPACAHVSERHARARVCV
jgi:hypothetical protein